MSAAENYPCMFCGEPFAPRTHRIILTERDNNSGRTESRGRLHPDCWRMLEASMPVLRVMFAEGQRIVKGLASP